MSSTDSIPALIPFDSNLPAIETGVAELELHKFSSHLAQVEVASCFRGRFGRSGEQFRDMEVFGAIEDRKFAALCVTRVQRPQF